MTRRKKNIWSISIILVIIILFFSGFKINRINKQIEWDMAVDAMGSMPYQIGLTNVMITKCFTTTPPPICNGGTLCSSKDFATCSNYSDVEGTPSGGMGMNALFSQTAIMQAGLSPGGQLIAGGMSPVFMDSGVLASMGGCAGMGCMVRSNPEKVKDFFRYIIAGFKK